MKKERTHWYQKLTGRLKNLKLVQKMVGLYVVMLGGCFVLSVAALHVSFRIYDSKLYEKSLQELDFFIQQVNRNLDEIEDLSYYIAIDTKIQEQLSKMKSLRHFTADYSYETYQLRMLLDRELMISDMISNIIYTDGKDTRFVVGTAKGEIDEGLYGTVMERIHEAQGGYVVQQPTDGYPYLLTGRDIRKHIDASLEYLGTILISSDVQGLIEKNIRDLEAESATLCIYSPEGVIYEEEEQMGEQLLQQNPPLTGDKGYRIIREGGQRYFLCYVKSSKTGWTYVNRFSYSEIYGQNQRLRHIVIASFLLLFLLSAGVLRRLAYMLAKPLKRLTDSMAIVETGDFMGAREFLGENTGNDEIGLLTQEFQVTLDKIDNLIHENYEKQILLKDTKYRMLQAQINPHFLYNTLNSINWMIRAKRNEEAAKMTVALGTILRAALSREQYFTMEEELHMLRQYITIQEYRYQKRAVFLVDVQVEGSYLIPHMTLQPLVENAIYHGVEKMLTPCTIAVIVREEEDLIRITVTDDGPGMTAQELTAVRNFTAQPKGHGIGLKNIVERLKMAFDQDAGFQIDSAPGRGTVVMITIPKRKAQEETCIK